MLLGSTFKVKIIICPLTLVLSFLPLVPETPSLLRRIGLAMWATVTLGINSAQSPKSPGKVEADKDIPKGTYLPTYLPTYLILSS